MPLVDIQVIEGVFDKAQKQEMIRTVTDAMVKIEGEAMCGVSGCASTKLPADIGASAARV